jgi:hypothetical protein
LARPLNTSSLRTTGVRPRLRLLLLLLQVFFATALASLSPSFSFKERRTLSSSFKTPNPSTPYQVRIHKVLETYNTTLPPAPLLAVPKRAQLKIFIRTSTYTHTHTRSLFFSLSFSLSGFASSPSLLVFVFSTDASH